MGDPLHTPPTRPIMTPEGELSNPIGLPPRIGLVETVPVAYDDLEPRHSYVHKGFEYLTDGQSLPARIRGGLRLVADPVRHPVAQRGVGRIEATADAPRHGGHIVAVSLGGFASGPDLFPQAANFNLSAFARLENGWRAAMAEGCAVEVDIALTVHPEHAAVPSMLIVTFWEDGDATELVLLNEEHAQ